MIRIVSAFFVPKGYSGISIGPFIIARDRDTMENPTFLNHEMIHFFQQLELLFIGFWILYPIFYVIGRLKGKSHDNAYRNNPFEVEAYHNHRDYEYLITRKLFNWSRFLKSPHF